MSNLSKYAESIALVVLGVLTIYVNMHLRGYFAIGGEWALGAAFIVCGAVLFPTKE